MEQFKEHLNYDKETGVFTWKTNKIPRKKAGDVASSFDKNGYIRIQINGVRHKAHRLAWFFVYNKWPSKHIDHKNGNRSDNRICNLRDVTIRENGQNRIEHRGGKLVGASFIKKTKTFLSRIEINKLRVCLGYYKTEQKAHEMYLLASKNIDKFNGNPKEFREYLKQQTRNGGCYG